MSASFRIRLADAFGWAVVVLTAAASFAGVVVPGLYRDTDAMVAQAQGSDLATLVVAVPLLALGLWLARRADPIQALGGRLTAGESQASLTFGATSLPTINRGRLVAMGALGFIAYSYAIYCFSVVINPATPLHIAILSLSTWSLVLLAMSLDASAILPHLGARLPRRTTAAFLVLCVVLFVLTWSRGLASAIVSGDLPREIAILALPTSPVYALDLAFALPLTALAAILLLRDDRRGPAAAIAMLTFTIVMGLGVVGSFAYAVVRGESIDGVVTGLFVFIIGVGTLLLALGLWPAAVRRVKAEPLHA